MTTQPNDGGPAFPFSTSKTIYEGMSLRAYFTGQALAGLMVGHTDIDEEGVADIAVNYADAAIRALNAAPTCKPDLQVEKKDVCVWRLLPKGTWLDSCDADEWGAVSGDGKCPNCGKRVQIGGES